MDLEVFLYALWHITYTYEVKCIPYPPSSLGPFLDMRFDLNSFSHQ